MKVFEILRNDVAVVTEDAVVERMKRFDWKYEFSDDVTKLAWGQRELELIENMVYQLWKKEPEKTVAMWNTKSPEGSEDKTIVPSFIIRLQEQED